MSRDMRTIMQQFSLIGKLLALVSLNAFTGCFGGSASREPQSVSTYFPLQVGNVEIRVQIVLTPPETQQGLMYRDSLSEDTGMLFVFEETRRLSFWMKNTKIPLDIAYIEPNGTIAEIYPLYPFNTDSVSSVGQNLSMALEMGQGWFASKDLRPGAQLDMKAVFGMVEARGFDTARFAIKGRP